MPHIHLAYEFGPFRLDLTQRLLTRADEIVPLRRKAMEILMLLVTNAGQLVEKDDLLKATWPNTFVEESNLSQQVFALRRALGDERAKPKYIETVTRRGYRFIAEVRLADGDGALNITGLAKQSGDGDILAPPVVAVLPFHNATGDAALDYLAEGVTSNIINTLSRVSRLRVMSRSTVFRFKATDVDLLTVGRNLGVSVVLVGKIYPRPPGVAIGIELVEVATGWQLWGESFACELKNILEIQEIITRQLLGALRLPLSRDDEKRITARYTDNAAAYQAYLEGRYYWSQFTRKGIEKAIVHFRQAIELDPNYALAYSGIVDCYLRLATNYLPPEDDASTVDPGAPDFDSESKVKLRFEWDWKGAERELRRANELKTDYPAAHQWYAAYRLSMVIAKAAHPFPHSELDAIITPKQLLSVKLSPNEAVQVFCAVARDQIEVGNYDAGCLMLREWWTPGELPNLTDLRPHSAADLLFTTGSLTSCLSSAGQMKKGQKHAEALLSGAIGLFEHLGAKRRSAESRIELALSYYRQGMFQLTRTTLLRALADLEVDDNDLRSVALMRLAVVERHAGQVQDSLKHLTQARELVEMNGPLVTGRYYHELATTLKDLAIAENRKDYSESVTFNFRRALYEFGAIGHHRYSAVVANNYGFLLLNLCRFKEAETHLERAQRLFAALNDKIRKAQVNDTLALLYLATERFDLAELAAERAVTLLEDSDEEALLAEALTTKGIILNKLKRHGEARGVLEGASRIAERCGDSEGAGRALLLLMENMSPQLEHSERKKLAARMWKLLEHSQQALTRTRVLRYLDSCYEKGR